ncbi:MAG: ABC transporter substrate-binding protein [Actinomycetota bacterium]
MDHAAAPVPPALEKKTDRDEIVIPRLKWIIPGLVIGLVSTVAVVRETHAKVITIARIVDNTTSSGGGTHTGGGGSSVSSNGLISNGVIASDPSLTCDRGGNGGATDTGVSSTSIRLGATVVQSGIGASFLGEVPDAMAAVVNQVNASGGVCGRLLDLKTVDDGWDASRGEQFIRNFISDGVFALAVSPSSEGLDAAIRNGDISRAKIPVVGADGMLISQYTEPWVWPVAASTITTMHVMAKNAFDRGARTFGLVYDKSYHFGVEGAQAFRAALKRLGGSLKADVGVEAGLPSYKDDVNNFNSSCTSCDFVAMLLEPPTALQWMRDGGATGTLASGGTGGPQPLFVDSFAQACGQRCNGMWVWTGYKPPIDSFASEPNVAQYVNDVHAYRPSVDVHNPFVEGGYLGMQLLVRALRAVGPRLTRERLKAVLDATSLDSGLTQPLSWLPGNHFANSSTMAFSIVENSGSFAGWRYQQTDWISDPWVGMDG